MSALTPAFLTPDGLEIIEEGKNMNIKVKKNILEKCILSFSFCKNQDFFGKAKYIKQELELIYPDKSFVVIIMKDETSYNYSSYFSYQKGIYLFFKYDGIRFEVFQPSNSSD